MKTILKCSSILLLLSFSQLSLAGTFIDSASVVSVEKYTSRLGLKSPTRSAISKKLSKIMEMEVLLMKSLVEL